MFIRHLTCKFSDLNALLKGFPFKLAVGARGQKTRIMGLPDGRKSVNMGLAVQSRQNTSG